MKNKKDLDDLRTVKYSFVVTVVLIVSIMSFGVGIFFGGIRSSSMMSSALVSTFMSDSKPVDVDMSPVWKAWNTIDDRFVPTGILASTTASSTPTGFTDKQERVWGMIQGMVASLGDPYTVFLPPSDAEIFQDDISGSFEGVGMEIAIRNGVLTVVSPLKGTPAFNAGIKSGDKVIQIDGQITRNMSINTAVKKIRGPKGTKVKLTVIRDGEKAPLEIFVIRDVINIPTLNTKLRSDGVFVIELLNFSAVSSGLFRQGLREFILSGSNRLLLDLRGNPGGFLGAAVDMASWFLPSGKVVVTEDHGKNPGTVVHKSKGYNIFTNKLKMVILVDRGSASASEILAGALRDHKIAKIVGSNTFGKGSVQELVDITKDSSLKITIARWLLPGGNSIPLTGIEPDIKIELTDKEKEDAKKTVKDVYLERAVKILLDM